MPKSATAAASAIFRKNWEDYRAHHITVMTGQRATAIDPESRTVTTESGRTLGYDRLVLAHGGSLFIPPIEGIDMEGVHSCKQLSEADRLDRSHGSAAVVIGSGAIGIEAGEALKKKGYEVTIIERDEGPDYLSIILKDGLVAGGQAIGKFADWIGLFMGAMWRKESLPFIRENWPVITRPGSNHPWTTRKLGELIGLKS